jgi:hypothetical protein
MPTKYWLYGYLLRDDWLLEYAISHGAIRHGVQDDGENSRAGDPRIYTAIGMITIEAGFLTDFVIGTYRKKDGRDIKCLAIASTDPFDEIRRHPPPHDRIQRLKDVFGTTKEPKWYKCISVSCMFIWGSSLYLRFFTLLTPDSELNVYCFVLSCIQILYIVL